LYISGLLPRDSYLHGLLVLQLLILRQAFPVTPIRQSVDFGARGYQREFS